jgi:hypothetical protein
VGQEQGARWREVRDEAFGVKPYGAVMETMGKSWVRSENLKAIGGVG